jgi:hypothetical protein
LQITHFIGFSAFEILAPKGRIGTIDRDHEAASARRVARDDQMKRLAALETQDERAWVRLIVRIRRDYLPLP